jgi:hypothetical protein
VAIVTPVLEQRFASGEYIAGAKPTQTVKIRKGFFERSYDSTPWDWSDVHANIIGSNNSSPWQATWVPTSSYMEIPGVLDVNFEQSFDNDGINTATITVDDIVYPEISGPNGSYHSVLRGYLSPLRGYSRPGFPGWPEGFKNEWFALLYSKAQITIWQGYGDEQTRVFTGLFDNVNMTSHPDRLSLTVRDFGQVLTDQHVFGSVKDPKLKDPITFVDKFQADRIKKVGYDAKSGTVDDPAHAAKNMLDTDSSTFWRSRSYTVPNATDWAEIHVPQGRYATVFVFNAYPGMTGYLSLFVRPRTDGQPCMFNGAVVPDNTWVDVGAGDVPGALGGEHYVREIDNMPDDRGYYQTFGDDSSGLPKELECGPGSVIRMSFRDLHETSTDHFQAGVRRMIALKRSVTAEASKRHYIAVEDVSDIVRVLLRWAGFKVWEVENTGVRLSKPLVIDRQQTLRSVIKQVADGTDFVFFMGDPLDEFAADMGTPIFRHIAAVRDDSPGIVLTEDQLLTGIQAKLDLDPLSTLIRIRGAPLKDDLSDTAQVKYVTYDYTPPWAFLLPGLRKYFIHNDPKYKTSEDCKFAAFYIALQEALASATGTVEFPGWPGTTLDSFVGVIDTGTGLITRLWVSNRSSTFHSGEQASWKLSVGGAMVDTPFVQSVVDVINANVRTREP